MDRKTLHGRSTTLIAAMTAAALILGCQTVNKRDAGTGIGAAIGALVGYQIDDGGAGGILLGAAVGGLLGRVIGDYMDEADRAKLAKTLDSTPTGETTQWQNEQTGNRFALTPTTDTYDRGEDQCRDFDQVVFIDGKQEVIQASACRRADDESWAVGA